MLFPVTLISQKTTHPNSTVLTWACSLGIVFNISVWILWGHGSMKCIVVGPFSLNLPSVWGTSDKQEELLRQDDFILEYSH